MPSPGTLPWPAAGAYQVFRKRLQSLSEAGLIAEQPWSPTGVEGRRQGALMASRVAAAAVVAALLLAAAYTVPGLLRGGELRITVPLGWARAKGYVAGFVQVVATSPKGYAVKTEYIDLGSTKTIDIDLPVKQAWTQSSLSRAAAS